MAMKNSSPILRGLHEKEKIMKKGKRKEKALGEENEDKMF